MTTNEITQSALKELNLRGWECWRNNNTTPVRGRTFIGRKGVSDIIGFNRNNTDYDPGVSLYAEVKNKGDKISEHQKELLDKAKMCGCGCFIATVDEKGQFILKEYNKK